MFPVFLAISIVFLLFPAPRARAGMVIKLPSSLGLATGLQGYWTFDGADIYESGTKAADKSGNNNAGTLTNMTAASSAVPGKIGQALKFDGSNDEISVADSSSLLDLPNAALSVSAWVAIKDNGLNGYIVSKSTGSATNGWEFNVDSFGRTVLIIQRATTDLVLLSTSNLPSFPSGWFHLAVTYPGGDTASDGKIYINGTAASTYSNTNGSGAYQSDSGRALKIGVNGFGNRANALIDEVRVYSRALSAAEIKRLYNMGGGVKVAAAQTRKVTTGLVGYWTFDGTDIYESGTVAADKSGNGRNGTLSGFTAINGSVPGPIGQALNFDGANDYVSSSNSSLNGATTFSISAWIYPRSRSDYDGIVVSRGTETFTFDLGGASSQGNDDVELWTDIGRHCSTTQNLITNNTWHHVTVTYNATSGSCAIYHNGVLRSTDTVTTHTSFDLDDDIKIGQDDTGGRFFDGSIDEVRIYNRVLSAAEIRALYNQGGVGLRVAKTQDDKLTTGLVGYWSFDGPDIWESGTRAADKSGNNNHGTLTNFTAATGAVPGQLGQALNFDGANDYVNTGSEFISTGADSISAWIYPRSVGEGNCGAIVHNFSTELNINCGLGNVFVFTSNNQSNNAVSASIATRYNSWIHVVATRNSSGIANIYVDGALSGTANQNSGTPAAGSSNVLIGNRNNSGGDQTFDGIIDEVRVYNRVLTAAEVKRLYEMGR